MNQEEIAEVLVALLQHVKACIETKQYREAWVWYGAFTTAWVQFRSELLGSYVDSVRLELLIVQSRLRQMERELIDAQERS